MSYEMASRDEVLRQERMAEVNNRISFETLDRLELPNGGILLDLGCGTDPSFGHEFAQRGGLYVPVDKDIQAVEAQRLAGHIMAGRVLTKNDENQKFRVPVGDSSVDAVHARFVFGWLNPDQRTEMMGEILRVSSPVGRIALLDYDWSDSEVTGPENYTNLMGEMFNILNHFGFYGSYGSQSHEPERIKIEKLVGGNVERNTVVWKTAMTLDKAMPVIDIMAKSLLTRLDVEIKQLRKSGHSGEFESLRQRALSSLLNRLNNQAKRSPSRTITTPSVVASAITFSK